MKTFQRVHPNRRPAPSRAASTAGSAAFRVLACALALWAGRVGAHEQAAGEAIECANLIYGGTKSSVCFSEAFLSAVASDTTIQTSRKFKPVKLGDSELFRFPFAVMTGEGSFTLTDSERVNLRRYLEGGGFLLASAGCSSREWGESFTREIQLIFPERSLAPVPMDHPIFRTAYYIDNLETRGPPAQLEGLTIAGKIVLIYTADGLNDTTSMHGCCCCGGNEIKNSRQVNANILTYALLQ
jgi:hypothetical protein